MNIRLPAFAIAGLYKDLLVIADEPIIKNPAFTPQVTIKNETEKNDRLQNAKEKKWLGDNKKNITVIVNDPTSAYINDEQLETLSKILIACKLTLADIAIVNQQHTAFNFIDLKKELLPLYIFMFDVSALEIELPFTIPHYQLQQYDGCTILTAPVITLSENKTDDDIKAEKRKLWVCMKQIFLS